MTEDDLCHLSCEVDDIKLLHKALESYVPNADEIERKDGLQDIFNRVLLDIVLNSPSYVKKSEQAGRMVCIYFTSFQQT